MTTNSAPTSPRRPKTPVWREVHEKVLTDRGLWSEEQQQAPREVSYAVGTRPAAHGGAMARTALQARTEESGVLQRSLDAKRFKVAMAEGHERPLFDKLDANHDGVLSRAEFAAGFGSSSISQSRQVDSLAQTTSSTPDAGDLCPTLGASHTLHGQDLDRQGRTSLSGLVAERDRLQRQVHEIRGAVADTRRDLTTQHENQRLQTSELRHTLANLSSDADSLQKEQRRQLQAATLKDRRLQKAAPDVEDQLGRKVDSVVSKLESQERQFARLENDVGSACAEQRAKLAEALAQSRQLARGLEEEGARRNASVAELQQVLIQGQRKEGLLAGQLQQDLVRATNAIQGQSGDWMELARTIKQEVSGLAGAMKADRDARAIEASSQRMEFARMIDGARRSNVCDTVETYTGGSSSECGQEMMSRAGAVAVRKMVDTTKVLLHGLEEALILRAGFIAGVFHTWRCEATLWKVGRRYQEEFARNQDTWEAHLNHHRRSFEEELRCAAERQMSHKDRMQLQKAVLLDQWAYGEAKGIVRESMRAWQKIAQVLQRHRRIAARIHTVSLQWAEGQAKGLATACFLAWRHRTLQEQSVKKANKLLEDAEQRHREELEKERKKVDKAIQDGLVQIEQTHQGAKQDLEVIIVKWEKGDRRGLFLMAMRAWDSFLQLTRRKKTTSEAIQLTLQKQLEGSAKGVKHHCFTNWRNEIFFNKSLQVERTKLEEILDGERAQQALDRTKELDKEAARVEAAKEGVRLMVRKWEMGSAKALKLEVFQDWARCCLMQAEAAARCASVEITLNKFMAGEKKGNLHACFLHWKTHSVAAALVKKAEVQLDQETEKMRAYLSDAERKHQAALEEQKSEAQRRKEEAEGAVEYTIARWNMGERKGLLTEVLRCWDRVRQDARRAAQARQAVHSSLLKSFQSNARATLQLSVLNWSREAREHRQERTEADRVNKERQHWEDAQRNMQKLREEAERGVQDAVAVQKAKAQIVTEMLLKKWVGGDRKGLVSSVFVDWKRHTELVHRMRVKRQTVKGCMLRYLEGELRGLMHSTLISWKNLSKMESEHKARIDQLEKQVEALLHRHEVRLTKYATFLGNERGPVLLGMVFNNWKASVHSAKYLEQERETEAKLEEMRLQHEMVVARKNEFRAGALKHLGAKDRRMVLFECFFDWKAYFDKVKLQHDMKMHRNKALTQYSEFVIVQRFKKDRTALLTSCFAEWRQEGLALRHEQAHDEAHRRLEEHVLYIQQLEQRGEALEENLMFSNRQIANITETLQKELQTKEELTAELREAYDKLRKSCFSPSAALTPTTAVNTTADGGAFSSWPSRPGSAQSRSHSTSSAALRSARLSNSGNRFDQELPQPASLYEPPADKGGLGFSSLGAGGPRVTSLGDSPPRRGNECDWDVAISAMHETGRLRSIESGGRM